jgi:hypothetical protein
MISPSITCAAAALAIVRAHIIENIVQISRWLDEVLAEDCFLGERRRVVAASQEAKFKLAILLHSMHYF